MEGSQVTQPSLLLRLRNTRDDTAWRDFVDLYTPLVYGYCLRRGLQDADAADVAQEVLKAVSQAITSFEYDRRRGSFRSWLSTVTRNKLRDFISTRNRHPRGSGATAVRELLEALPDRDEEESWEREYRQCLFLWASGKVRQEFQEATWRAFWATAVEERPVKEVATELGMSAGAVYIAKSRVTAQLRERIREADDD